MIAKEHWQMMQRNELQHWAVRGTGDYAADPNKSRVIWDRFGIDRDDYAGKWVLDVGCGPTGRTAYFQGASIVGLDPLALEYQSRWPTRMSMYAGLISLPAETFVIELKGSCDLIVCLNCLDHCQDPAKVLSNLSAYLRPSGLCFLSTDVATTKKHLSPGDLHCRHVPKTIVKWIRDAELRIERHEQGKTWPMPDGTWNDGYTANTLAHHWWLRRQSDD